jgi:tetratricopeptide (TPR) repeat protein
MRAVLPNAGAVATITLGVLVAAPAIAGGADQAAVMTALDRCLDRETPAREAEAACGQAAIGADALDPSQQAALAHRRGQIALVQGRPAEAVLLLDEATRQEPLVAPYLLTLGDALLANGEIERAVAVYQQGQELAPSSKVFAARLNALPAVSPSAVAQQ